MYVIMMFGALSLYIVLISSRFCSCYSRSLAGKLSSTSVVHNVTLSAGHNIIVFE